jgi:transposase-like protein
LRSSQIKHVDATPYVTSNWLCRNCAHFANDKHISTDLIFRDETSAREYIESTRWPGGVTCTGCGCENVTRLGGQTQAGMLLCRDCRKKFTCRDGTALAHSHIPLHKWLLTLFLLAKGELRLSPQLLKSRLDLGSYRTAWHMAQRIRDTFSRQYKELDRFNRQGREGVSPCVTGPKNPCGEKWRPSFDVGLKAMLSPAADAESLTPRRPSAIDPTRAEASRYLAGGHMT